MILIVSAGAPLGTGDWEGVSDIHLGDDLAGFIIGIRGRLLSTGSEPVPRIV